MHHVMPTYHVYKFFLLCHRRCNSCEDIDQLFALCMYSLCCLFHQVPEFVESEEQSVSVHHTLNGIVGTEVTAALVSDGGKLAWRQKKNQTEVGE